MRAAVLACLAATACGRIGFAEHTAVIDAAIDGAVDARADARVDRIGCSDGAREGYVDPSAFPTIAACGATWDGARDLRAARTGAACGDDLGPCAAPADACAAGWHMCGAGGDPAELLVLTADQCRTGASGNYVAALQHCGSAMPCAYPAPGAWQCPGEPVADCKQPACCGDACDSNTGCTGGIWPGETFDDVDDGAPCGASVGSQHDGVLCCRG